MTKHTQIDQHTLVPVGVAIAAISSVVLWAAHIQFSTDAIAAKLREDEVASGKQTETLLSTLGSIDHRLSIIEGEVKRIKQ